MWVWQPVPSTSVSGHSADCLPGSYGVSGAGSPLLSSLALVRGADQLVLVTSGHSALAGHGTTRDVLPPEIQITGNLSVPTVTLLRSVSSGVYTKTGALSGVHTEFVRGLGVILIDSIGGSANALSSIALSAGFATYYHAGSSVEPPVSIIRRMDPGLLSVSGIPTKAVWQLLRDAQTIPLGVEGVSVVTGLGLAVPVANGIYLVVGHSGEVALVSSAWILSPGSTVIEGSIVRSLSSLQRELAVGQTDTLGFNAILRRLFAAVVNLGLYTYSGTQADASVVEGWYLLPGSLLVDGQSVLSSLAVPRNATVVSVSATGNETALSLGRSANLTYSAYVCDGHTVFSVSDRRIPVAPGSVLLVPRSLELVLIYPTLYPVVTFKAKKKTLVLSGPVLTRKSRPQSQRRANPPEVKKAGRKGMLPS